MLDKNAGAVKILQTEVNVINIGLKKFYKELKENNTKTININWRPPAGGNIRLMSLLSKLKK